MHFRPETRFEHCYNNTVAVLSDDVASRLQNPKAREITIQPQSEIQKKTYINTECCLLEEKCVLNTHMKR